MTAVFSPRCRFPLSARGRSQEDHCGRQGENEDLILTDPVQTAEIKQLVGSDLEATSSRRVKVEPKYGKEIAVDPDDFVLWTNKDGEHTQPTKPVRWPQETS